MGSITHTPPIEIGQDSPDPPTAEKGTIMASKRAAILTKSVRSGLTGPWRGLGGGAQLKQPRLTTATRNFYLSRGTPPSIPRGTAARSSLIPAADRSVPPVQAGAEVHSGHVEGAVTA